MFELQILNSFLLRMLDDLQRKKVYFTFESWLGRVFTMTRRSASFRKLERQPCHHGTDVLVM